MEDKIIQEQQNTFIDVEKILTITSRQDVATKIDAALGSLGLNFYEVLLGICDFTTTILTLELSKILETQENKEASSERVNNIRDQICDVLNKREAKFLAEEMVAVISILVESIIIGLKREQNAQNKEMSKTE